MKIAIPTQDDRASEARVSPHFGRTPYFALVDTKTGEVKMLPNEDAGDRHHGYGAARRVKALGVDAVVCRSMGPGALASLEASGINVYRCSHATVARVVDRVRTNRLARFQGEKACADGQHHGAHGRGQAHGNEKEK